MTRQGTAGRRSKAKTTTVPSKRETITDMSKSLPYYQTRSVEMSKVANYSKYAIYQLGQLVEVLGWIPSCIGWDERLCVENEVIERIFPVEVPLRPVRLYSEAEFLKWVDRELPTHCRGRIRKLTPSIVVHDNMSVKPKVQHTEMEWVACNGGKLRRPICRCLEQNNAGTCQRIPCPRNLENFVSLSKGYIVPVSRDVE